MKLSNKIIVIVLMLLLAVQFTMGLDVVFNGSQMIHKYNERIEVIR